jgi:hypothetical protein
MFRPRSTLRLQEQAAVQQVMETGSLSDFLGCWHEEKFFGGTSVKALEKNSKTKFGVKHAISVNSWTSGLICASWRDRARARRRGNHDALDDERNCDGNRALEWDPYLRRHRPKHLQPRPRLCPTCYHTKNQSHTGR